MKWLVDTDVISQPAKRLGHPLVLAWLEANRSEFYTSTIVLAQLAYWVRAAEGRSRTALQSWLGRLQDSLEGRILSFNTATAFVWADMQREMEKRGYTMQIEDGYIAATARRHGLTIVTGNERDFRRCGVKVLNPFKARA